MTLMKVSTKIFCNLANIHRLLTLQHLPPLKAPERKEISKTFPLRRNDSTHTCATNQYCMSHVTCQYHMSRVICHSTPNAMPLTLSYRLNPSLFCNCGGDTSSCARCRGCCCLCCCCCCGLSSLSLSTFSAAAASARAVEANTKKLSGKYLGFS